MHMCSMNTIRRKYIQHVATIMWPTMRVRLLHQHLKLSLDSRDAQLKMHCTETLRLYFINTAISVHSTPCSAQLTYFDIEHCEEKQVNWDKPWTNNNLPDQKKINQCSLWMIEREQKPNRKCFWKYFRPCSHYKIWLYFFNKSDGITAWYLHQSSWAFWTPYWCHKHLSQSFPWRSLCLYWRVAWAVFDKWLEKKEVLFIFVQIIQFFLFL